MLSGVSGRQRRRTVPGQFGAAPQQDAGRPGFQARRGIRRLLRKLAGPRRVQAAGNKMGGGNRPHQPSRPGAPEHHRHARGGGISAGDAH